MIHGSGRLARNLIQTEQSILWVLALLSVALCGLRPQQGQHWRESQIFLTFLLTSGWTLLAIIFLMFVFSSGVWGWSSWPIVHPCQQNKLMFYGLGEIPERSGLFVISVIFQVLYKWEVWGRNGVHEWRSCVERRFFFVIITGILTGDWAPAAYVMNTTCLCKYMWAACSHWNDWGHEIITSVEWMEESGSGSKSGVASYSYMESFAFGQLFISPFPQTTHCKMRDWKNIAGKLSQREHKGQKQQWKKQCVLRIQVTPPTAARLLWISLLPLAITEQWPDLRKDHVSTGLIVRSGRYIN